MHPRLFRAYRLVWTALVAMLLATFPIVARADSGPVFSGQATAISGTVLNVPVTFGDTGYQNSSGFAEHASGPSVSYADPTGTATLSAETLHATTIGQGDRARSEASLAEVNLTVAGNTIAASFLMAQAMAVCTASGPSVSGSSQLADVVVNGNPIPVGTAANTTFPVGPVTLYINQQQPNSAGNAIDVTALRVVVIDPVTNSTLADVSFSHVHADVLCGSSSPNCSSPNDFVTGGGWIIPQDGPDKANFAVAGGWKNDAYWGHLELIDHNNGTKIHGTGVSAYQEPTPTTRHIEGYADMNGQPVTYKVDVADNDPTGGRDSFALQVFDPSSPADSPPVYMASNDLGGGDIQIHHPCS